MSNKTKKFDLKNATTKEIIFFSLIPFGLLTIQTLIGTALNLYLTDVLGLSLALTSIILSGTKVWDAVNDPIMGMIVDKTRTKWGKCRPYLLWMAIPACLATSFLFFPVNFGEKGNFVYVLIAYIVYYVFYTALDIPYQGLNSLVFPEDKTRVRAVSVSNVVGAVGTILPSVLFFTVAGLWGTSPEQQKKGYFGSAVIFALMACIPIVISFFGIKEKVYIPPKKNNYFKGLKLVFSDSKMRILTICAFFNGIVNIGAMFLPYFAKWNCIGVLPVQEISAWLSNLLGVNISITSEGLLIPLLQIGSGISYMLSMAIIPFLLKRMDKKTLWIWMSALGAIADILTFVVGIWIIPYNTAAGAITYTILRFFTNYPVGMSLVLLIAMFSDTVDDLEMKSGERLEGTVFSFRSLVNKISIAVFNVIMLNIVGAVGYEAIKMTALTKEYTVPLITSPTVSSVINGVDYTLVLNVIFFMLSALGAIGLIGQMIPMFFYKFDEKTQEAKLIEFRAQKELAMQAELDRLAAGETLEESVVNDYEK